MVFETVSGTISYKFNEYFCGNILAVNEVAEVGVKFGNMEAVPVPSNSPLVAVGTGIYVVPNIEAGVGNARVGWSNKVTQKNVLQCLFYNAVEKHLVFESRGKSLQTYITDWWLNEGNNVIGYYDVESYTGIIHRPYLDTHIRKLVRGMYECLYGLHRIGYSPLDLDMEKVSVVENVELAEVVVKIFVLDFKTCTPESQRADFAAIRDMIQNVLPNPDGLLDHLFDLSDSWLCSEPEHGKIFTLHPSIIPPSDVLRFVARCGEWINTNNMTDKKMIALLEGMPDCKGWDARFTRNEEDEWLRDYFLPKPNKGIYTGGANEIRQSLIRCLRNLAVHYTDSISNRTDLAQQTECAVMYLFKDEIFCLYRSIASSGLWKYLEDD